MNQRLVKAFSYQSMDACTLKGKKFLPYNININQYNIFFIQNLLILIKRSTKLLQLCDTPIGHTH
jgi:hypothetical protein